MEHTLCASADGWLAVRLADKAPTAEGILRFVLEPPEGGALPAFSAGAHIEIELPAGMVRPYSLCNSPHERDRYEVAVLLEPNGRGGSKSAHQDLSVGQMVRIRPPRNLFPLAEEGHSLLVAGGIGVTPLIAMGQHLAATGRPFTLHYAVRSRGRAALLDRLVTPPFAGRVYLHCDDGAGAAPFNAGRALAEAPEGSHLYVCGPQGFMDHVLATARAAGWPPERIHFEYFAAAPTARADDDAFELVLARSGRVVPVAAGQSAIAALHAQGIAVPLSCEQGICGTCALGVIEGEPDHRDSFFNAAEHAANTVFTPCCSRSRSARLVIDL